MAADAVSSITIAGASQSANLSMRALMVAVLVKVYVTPSYGANSVGGDCQRDSIRWPGWSRSETLAPRTNRGLHRALIERGPNPILFLMMHRNDPEIERLIVRYWRQHKTVAVILAYLRLAHRVSVSLTWLKKKLSQLGLRRHNYVETHLPLLYQAIRKELQTSNRLLGYRSMWKLIQTKYGYTVKRSTVMMLLAVMDPEGTRQRKMHRLQRRTYENMGPNWCWHMDGYDKLKPYGFPIHACIDGFSRKIIWLELSTTNNDPGVVAQYYLTAVFQLGGCPARMRSDHGTENVTIATCQMAFRHYHGDRYAGANSFIFGSSIRNCRIESWWSRLRNFRMEWWIDLFKTLVDNGLYDCDVEHQYHTAGYVFGPLLQQELKEFKDMWNCHRIRRNRFAACPCDVPDDVYNLYSFMGEDYRQSIDPGLLAHCMVHCAHNAPPFYPPEFQVLADNLLSDLFLTQGQITVHNCKAVYLYMDPPKRIKSKNDSTVFQKKVMEYLNQQSKSSSTDAATKEPILTREKLINKYQACTSAKRRSSDRDQRSTEESLFGMKVCQMEKTRNKTYKRIGDCLRVSGFRSTDTYKDTLQKATSSFDDAAQADAGTLIISMGRVANCPLQNGKPWTLGGYLDELGGSRRITIGVYLPNDTSSDEQSSGTPQQGRAVYKASYHFKVINCTPMFPKISFAQKGSGGNLVTGCTHQAKSGTKVALACLGCDQTCHYHDAVMGLTWLVRVEARRVPPAIDNQLLWMKKILFPGIEKIQENIQFPRMQFPEKIQFLGMQFPEKIQFPGMQFPEKIQFSRIEFLRNVENQKLYDLSCKDELMIPYENLEVTEVTLGSGTFGVVVKGVYLGTEVAIKMIKMDDDMNLKTHLEVQIMRQLRHPNIITLMGISSNKSELLIVMNLVNGFNVDQVIFKQALPLDTNTVRSIAVQITKALTYMHGRSPRVIHHDIKPSNIMVTGSHHVFVCDLGLAKLQNHLATIKTSKGCGAGTVPYKAPEMFYDGKRSTPADIYSFGCVLIELTTSRRVWGTMDGYQITAKVCGSYQLLPEPPSTDAVPEPYKNLCAQCTRLNQAERPSALAVLHQLMAL
eukprot:Em0007g378a